MNTVISEKERKAALSIMLLICFVFFIFSLSALAADKGVDKATEGLNKSASMGFLGHVQTGEIKEIASIPETLGTVVGAGLAFIGVLFFILIIYGGLLWMTARGNETQVTKAKDLITAAIIGLIIVLAAYAITAYVSQLLLK